ncbi:hypothetical protein [Mucilaginibacter sp.]|uniref:hypothetical protein n=1 Tax=Mucilaginibacter sp. TaxID=1882438 RepID=UPI003B00A9BA
MITILQSIVFSKIKPASIKIPHLKIARKNSMGKPVSSQSCFSNKGTVLHQLTVFAAFSYQISKLLMEFLFEDFILIKEAFLQHGNINAARSLDFTHHFNGFRNCFGD